MARSKLPRGLLRFYNNNGSKLLRLPQELAVQLPDDQVYRLDVDEDGIHLRPVASIEQQMPAWAQRSQSSSAPESTPEGEEEEVADPS